MHDFIRYYVPSAPQVLSLSLSLWHSAMRGYTRRGTRRPRLSYFDIDTESGFMPSQPLPRLPQPFEIWESALEGAPETLSLGEDDDEEAIEKRASSQQWRRDIRLWPVLCTDTLHGDIRRLQRAHMVLAWLVHFFIHSIPPPSKTGATTAEEAESPVHVPRALAVPLVKISNTLGIAPVLTYADTVLWNWELIRPELPTSIENMHFKNLFSGTEDEFNFYMASARAELRGAEVLHIIEDFNNRRNATDLASISKTVRDLTRLTGIIDDIGDIIQSVRGTCDPHVFYWAIRPWYEGSGAPGEKRWVYEGVPHSKDLDLSGPSGGQSSLMHAIDIFLDVDHKLQQRREPAPSESNKKAEPGFMERMRQYMPGRHRDYLAHLVATPLPLRELALETPMLQESYDAAVLALKKLRDSHMRIACRYIVTMSRSNPSARPGCPVSAMIERMKRDQKGPARGTGGNELCVLLKAGRDATRRTLIRKNTSE